MSQQDYDSLVASGLVDPYTFVQNNSDFIAAWDAYKVSLIAFYSARWSDSMTGAIEKSRDEAESNWRDAIDLLGSIVAQGYADAGINSADDARDNWRDYSDLNDSYVEPLFKNAMETPAEHVISATLAFGAGVRERLNRAARESEGVFNSSPVVSFDNSVETVLVQGSATPDFMAGVTVVDDRDGVIDPSNITVDHGGFDANVVGSYTVTYTVSDSEGATTVENRYFTVSPDVSLITADDLPMPSLSNIGATVDITGGRVDFPFNPDLVYNANPDGDRYWLKLTTQFLQPDGSYRGGGTARTYGPGYWQEDTNAGTWYANVDSNGNGYENVMDSWKIMDGDIFEVKYAWVNYNTITATQTILAEKVLQHTVTTSGYTQPDISNYLDDIDVRGNTSMTEVDGTVSYDLPWKIENNRSPVGLFGSNQALPAGSRYAEVSFGLFTASEFFRNGTEIASFNGYTRNDSWYASSGGDFDGSTYWYEDGSRHFMGNIWGDRNTYGFGDGSGGYTNGIQSGDEWRNTYKMFVQYYDDQGNYVASQYIELGTESLVMS
jgi:hypothetical protein